MASIRSLGLHRPSALSYCIAESILPSAPSNENFTWKTFSAGSLSDSSSDEEIIFTETHVVWSRGGVVKRAFDFSVEQESVVDAFFAAFPSAKEVTSKRKGSNERVSPSLSEKEDLQSRQNVNKRQNRSEKKPASNNVNFTEAEDVARKEVKKSMALVVVLKTQAHVFFLSGERYSVPLPFEVVSVWPTTQGLLLQRKFARSSSPMSPISSYLSSLSRATRSSEYVTARTSPFSSATSFKPSPPGSMGPPRSDPESSIPRVYTLMDPQSELGLVVAPKPSQTKGKNATPQTNLDDNVTKSFGALDSSEEVIYVSPSDELPSRSPETKPLLFVITTSEKTGMVTVWAAHYRDRDKGLSQSKKSSSNQQTQSSKRRSSHFDHLSSGAGATTPIARQSTLRESFGPHSQSRDTSFAHSDTDETEEFASQLLQDMPDIGFSTKASRRVSSRLARTDLAANSDRGTSFSEFAAGNQSYATVHSSIRRGDSLGGRNSLNFRRKSSILPTNASIYSNVSSQTTTLADRSLEGSNTSGDFSALDGIELTETVSRLPKELILMKIDSFYPNFSPNLYSHDGKRNRLKVFTISRLHCDSTDDPESSSLAICIFSPDPNSGGLTVVDLVASQSRGSPVTLASRVAGKKKSSKTDTVMKFRSFRVCHVSNVKDCCKITDGDISRILILTKTMEGPGELILETPWSVPVRIMLPEAMISRDPFAFPCFDNDFLLPKCSSSPSSSLKLVSLDHEASNGLVDVVDTEGLKHRVQIQLQPRNHKVKQILNVCKFVLQHADRVRDGVHVGWWDVFRWLQTRGLKYNNHDELEWTAMVVTLFSMAVYFIEPSKTKKPVEKSPSKSRRRKPEPTRPPHETAVVDMDKWTRMIDHESGLSGAMPAFLMDSVWEWTALENPGQDANSLERPEGGHHRQNGYILYCIELSKRYLDNPEGENAIGAEGFLPTAICGNQETRKTALGAILIGLHLLREEWKLSILDAESSRSETGVLLPILAQLGGYLSWPSWTWHPDGYYGNESASLDLWLFDDSKIGTLDIQEELFPPPSIFEFVDKSATCEVKFLTLVDMVSASSDKNKPIYAALAERAARLTPRSMSLTRFFDDLRLKSTMAEKLQLLDHWKLTNDFIDTLPDGIAIPMHDAIVSCQASPIPSWNGSLLRLIDRDDLLFSQMDDTDISMSRPVAPTITAQHQHPHEAVRDPHHLAQASLEANPLGSFEVSAEADRLTVTRLIFREDRRYWEAMKILNQSRVAVAECIREPGSSDSEYLDAQKDLAQLVAYRTLSIPVGRAMVIFSSRIPLLTEKLPIPSFSLQCLMRPSNVNITAERSTFSEEKVSWAFFHNGVSIGLSVSRDAKGIESSWILYNKPGDLTNRHAGFLLALGLNGHLKSLVKWVTFKYLTPKHTMTSIGLLLGLAASHLGEMSPVITRLLSMHITRMLPPGAADLNVSPLTQTAGILGIGLLYSSSQHRRMSEIMLSEMENVDLEDQGTLTNSSQELLRDEGYRLAAGFALGLINLGKGHDLKGLRDMYIVGRLQGLAVKSKTVDLVHILDKATAGATMALTMIYMKSNDTSIADGIDVPDTAIQFDYVRPDIFLLRTLSKHLIMWDGIQAEESWVKHNLPPFYRRRYRLTDIRRLSINDLALFNIIAGLCFAVAMRHAGSGSFKARDLLLHYLDQLIRICRLPAMDYDSRLTRNYVRNCQDLLGLSAAAVMAGMGDIPVFRRLRSLHGRVDAETPYGSHMAANMAIGMLFLGGGTYTLGTSNLAIASLLISFYPIFPMTVLDNKCHLQAFRHLWVLAAEPRCLVPRDLETRRAVSVPASLSMKTGEKRDVVAPCLLPDLTAINNIRILSPDHWDLTLDVANSEGLREKFKRTSQSVYLRRRPVHSNATGSSVFHSTLMTLSEGKDILTTLPRSTAVPGANANNNAPILPAQGQQPLSLTSSVLTRFPTRPLWDWIFNLPSFSILDMNEKALVLPTDLYQQHTNGCEFLAQHGGVEGGSSPMWLRQSPVDERLVLESTIRALRSESTSRDIVRDRLWQLKLLFAWLDIGKRSTMMEVDFATNGTQGKDNGVSDMDVDMEKDANDDAEEKDMRVTKKEETRGLWIGNEVVEDMKWRIWGIQVGDQ